MACIGVRNFPYSIGWFRQKYKAKGNLTAEKESFCMLFNEKAHPTQPPSLPYNIYILASCFALDLYDVSVLFYPFSNKLLALTIPDPED